MTKQPRGKREDNAEHCETRARAAMFETAIGWLCSGVEPEKVDGWCAVHATGLFVVTPLAHAFFLSGLALAPESVLMRRSRMLAAGNALSALLLSVGTALVAPRYDGSRVQWCGPLAVRARNLLADWGVRSPTALQLLFDLISATVAIYVCAEMLMAADWLDGFGDRTVFLLQPRGICLAVAAAASFGIMLSIAHNGIYEQIDQRSENRCIQVALMVPRWSQVVFLGFLVASLMTLMGFGALGLYQAYEFTTFSRKQMHRHRTRKLLGVCCHLACPFVTLFVPTFFAAARYVTVGQVQRTEGHLICMSYEMLSAAQCVTNAFAFGGYRRYFLGLLRRMLCLKQSSAVTTKTCYVDASAVALSQMRKPSTTLTHSSQAAIGAPAMPCL